MATLFVCARISALLQKQRKDEEYVEKSETSNINFPLISGGDGDGGGGGDTFYSRQHNHQ